MKSSAALREAVRLAAAGDGPRAIEQLEAAIVRARKQPAEGASLSLLAKTAAVLCEGEGRVRETASYYEVAIASDERDPWLHVALAEVRQRLGERDAALAGLIRAESLARAGGDAEVLSVIDSARERWADSSSQ